MDNHYHWLLRTREPNLEGNESLSVSRHDQSHCQLKNTKPLRASRPMSFLKKNWYFVVPVGFLALPLIMILYISASYGYTFPEAFQCFKAIGQENTKFQTLHFSESSFRRIQPGMNGRDVFELIGVPLERHDNDTKWHYSLPVSGAQFYHERTVKMEAGKVTEVICRFHSPESK